MAILYMGWDAHDEMARPRARRLFCGRGTLHEKEGVRFTREANSYVRNFAGVWTLTTSGYTIKLSSHARHVTQGVVMSHKG